MQEIDMHMIEIFITVARFQNISKAADFLYISQPTVSSWISKMEELCGVPLFERTNRGVKLTTEGEVIFARLDLAFHSFRISAIGICSPSEKNNNILHIGYPHFSDIRKIVDSEVENYNQLGNGITAKCEKYNFHELRYKLLCGELDIAFLLSYDLLYYQEYDYTPYMPSSAWFFIPESWRNKTIKSDLKYLNGKPLIVESRSGKNMALSVCEANGITPSEIKYVSSNILLSTQIVHGSGFTVFGDFLDEYFNYPKPVRIPIKHGYQEDYLIAWKKGALKTQAEDFIHFLLNRK
jgi:DNA-binding transcriptional LysR family regulator